MNLRKLKGVLLIIISIIGIGFLLLVTNNNLLNNIQDGFRDNLLENSPIDDGEKSDDITSSNSGNTGEDANGSVLEISSESGCIIKQISYSLINLNRTSICNAYQNSVCINKTVNCYIEIQNRDSSVSGSFKVELFFLEEGGTKENNAFYFKNSEFFLNPSEYYIFEDFTSIQSTGENGLANKEINCFYNTIEVPKKEIC